MAPKRSTQDFRSIDPLTGAVGYDQRKNAYAQSTIPRLYCIWTYAPSLWVINFLNLNS